jgi:hypothetical protein
VKRKILSLLVLLIVIIGAQTGFAQDTIASPEENLVVGAAMIDITPDRSLVLGGYGMYVGSRKNCRWSDGVHDPLYATALYFGKGSSHFVLIEMDLVGFIFTDVNDVQDGVAERIGISRDHVIVASSHTHHSPDTYGLWGTIIPPYSGRNEQYMDFVKEQATQAAYDAYNARKPARLQYAVGEESELHFNVYEKDDEKAYIDHTLTVVKAVDRQGKTIATITNWGCHPTTEHGQNLKISSDWVGPFRDRLSEKSEGIHMFVNGSIGAAIQPSVPWRDEHLKSEAQGFVWAEALGTRLADKVLGLLEKTQPLSVDRIVVKSSPVSIRMKNFAIWLAKSSGQTGLPVPAYGQMYHTDLVAVQMGDLRYGTMPGEMSPQLGMEIRNELGGKAQILVGLGMDSLGYIIDEEQYADKTFIYEKFLCIHPRFGKTIVDAYHEMGMQ